MVLCRFSGLKVQILAHIQLFLVVVFYKLKSIQNTTNITEITGNSLKLSTLHSKQIQIGKNFPPIVYSTKAQNLTLLTFLTIVLTLNPLLTCTGQQSEQVIAPIQLLWRRMHRVLKIHVTFFLHAHNEHLCQLPSWELITIKLRPSPTPGVT